MYERVGMGWSNWRDSPGDSCDQVPDGQQRCFRTTAVNGQPNEQSFARSQGCVLRGDQCSTSDGNPGNVWCCPPGWPIGPGAPPLEPRESPPVASSMMQALPWVVGLAAVGLGFWYWKKGR
jgi:hypothetical protein